MRCTLAPAAGLAALLAVRAACAAAVAAPTPSGQSITADAAPGALFQTLDPGLAAYPAFRAGQAVSVVVSPDRATLLVLTSGYNTLRTPAGAKDRDASKEFIFVYDISHHAPVRRQVLTIPAAYAGIAFSPDGRRFYVGSGGGDSVYAYAQADGSWRQSGAPIALGHGSGNGNRQGPSTAGLAVSDDGGALLVANVYNDSVSLLDLQHGQVRATLDLRPGIIDPARSGQAGGESPFWVAIAGRTAYVSSQRDREIDVLGIDGASLSVRARIAVRGTPNRMLLNRAATRLYVACDNDDSVQVIDTATNRVIDTIPVAAPDGLLPLPRRYRGAAPNALALSADESTLYVSNGGENAVAVVALSARPHVTALLPTGWYPNAVGIADGWLYVVNGKSDPGANPGRCQGSIDHSAPQPVPYAATCRQNQYVLTLEAAGLLAEPIPGAADQRRLTLQVAANNGFTRKPDPRDASVMAALHARIRHVIYIIKENRTYDQVLGDLGRGNGDPSIVEFGAAITPNFHALASNFVDLDNFLDSGAVSGNGWQWSTASRETDVNAKLVPMQYSGRKTDAPYEAEGQNRGVDVGIATLAARRDAAPRYPDDPNLLPGTNDDAAPDGPDDDDDAAGKPGGRQHGYLWNAVLDAGLSVRNYGFFEDLDRYGVHGSVGKDVVPFPEEREPFARHLPVAVPVNPDLAPRTDLYFRGFDNKMPDYWRYREWDREFSDDERRGTLPSLSLVRLMHDHMGSFAEALDGVNTPELQQADNDYAVGLLAARVAHSRFAGDTLIFVVEDDAQDGPDHVDAHRSTAYVIGPYVKHGAVVSTRYTTVNMLRTIEDILGTRHLDINDATQPPMTDLFDLRQAHWNYDAVPSRYLLATGLPLPRDHAALQGELPRSTHDAAWWTASTRGYDWTHEDKVPTQLFNAVLWRGLHPGGTAPPVRGGR